MINKYFKNKELLEKDYSFYLKNHQIISKECSENLISAHIHKAEHNLKLLEQLSSEFNDWKIVSIYYSLYHACLALVANKNFVSKNHTATLIFLIKHYSELNKTELKLISELQIKEQDAIFYTELKNSRHNASYSTNLFFNDNDIVEFKNKTIIFLTKVKEIITY